MKINKKSWHYKWYCWFKGTNYPDNTNLCPYARTVFFYTPLKFLFAKGFIGKISVPGVIYPVLLIEIPRWLGMVSYTGKMVLYFMYTIVASAISVLLLAYGIIKLSEKLVENDLRSKMTDDEWSYFLSIGKKTKYLPDHVQQYLLGNRIINWVEKTINRLNNSLLINYIKTFHNKICPFITFED